MAYEFLDEKHPIFVEHEDEWERRERLLRGGVEVIDEELERFGWEEDDTHEHYLSRKSQAVYPGFGEAFLRTLIGHVLKDRPETDGGLAMGRMGVVQRGEGEAKPTQAEQVFYNVNGTGGDGQQLWQYVAAVFQRAGATGLRWVLTEMPVGMSNTREDEINGHRPYAVEFSPRVVPNWKIERGQLQWCVIKIRTDTRRVVDGRMQGAANEPGYYLLVRKGDTSLGETFQGGGWWKFDENREMINGGHGDWSKTNGEIPMALAVWEWESESVDDDTPLPLARSATTALDNLSVAFMNLKSAWRSNAWRSAGSADFLLGVDTESWKITKEQYIAGSGLIGVPASHDGATPSLAHGSAGLVSSESFRSVLEDMVNDAERLMVQEATSAPDSSGRSKEAGFTESKAPRLTMLAENIESFLNTMLRFFELRFGHSNPGAYVQMPRQFDLAPVEEEIGNFFETFRRSQLRSASLETDAMMRLAEKVGLVNDENRAKVRKELEDSVRAAATGGVQEGGLFADIFRGNGRTQPPATEPEPEPAVP